MREKEVCLAFLEKDLQSSIDGHKHGRSLQ